MKKRFIRMISLCLTICMMVGMVPFSAFAVEDDGAVRVEFVCEPEELTLVVKQGDDKISAEEDGSYLLLPGEYTYTAKCGGYETVKNQSFTVDEDTSEIEVALDAIPAVVEETEAPVETVPETTETVVEPTEEQTEPETEPVVTVPPASIEETEAVEEKTVPAVEETQSQETVEEVTVEKKVTTTAANASIVASGTCGDNLGWSLDSEGTLRISGTGKMEGYSYVSADSLSDAPWGEFVAEIKSLVIGDRVTTIGKWAFSGCSGLTSVTIPGSVTSIGDYAFYGCSGLTSVTIPGSVTSIGNYAFYYCSGLTSVTIPEGVTSIGTGVFGYCSGLTSVTIPKGITSISDYAFHNCGGLTSVTIPDGVTSIGEWAFCDCSGLTSVTIPEGVTSIGRYAFSDCSGLTSVTIPEGVTSIGNDAFYGCSGLTSVTIPGSVTSIGFGAFAGCRRLTSVTIPESVTSIGESAFYDCSGLTSVTIPGSVTSIGIYAFHGCSGLTSVTIPDGVTSIGDWAFHGCSGLTSVTIPEGVTSIGERAFHSCSGLTSVTIPKGVTSISNYAFFGCSGLTSVTIPGSVTSIGHFAFSGCSSLTSVTIPGSVKSIGYGAFYDCSSLTSVTIPGSVTSISDHAFDDCSGLHEITFAGDLPQIGSDAFEGVTATAYYPKGNTTYANAGQYGGKLTWVAYGPDSIVASGTCGDNLGWSLNSEGTLLISGTGKMTDYEYSDKWAPWYSQKQFVKSIVIENGVSTIGDYAFYGCSGLTSVTIPGSVTSIGEHAFYGCSGLTSVTIPEGVTSIGIGVFANCSVLTSVTIPEGVTSIGTGVFAHCSGLTSVTIPEGVTSIGDSAFENCSGLTGVTIPKGVTSIGKAAFYNCSGLTSVTIPEGVTSIGDHAFYNCSGLTSVTIPEGVTSIGGDAFSGCSSLTSVTIPKGVTSIGQYAFYDCSGLTSISFEGDLPQILYDAFSGVTATAYYPKDNTTYANAGQYGGNLTWVPYVPGSEVPQPKLNKLDSIHYLAFSNMAYANWKIGDVIYNRYADKWNNKVWKGNSEVTYSSLYGDIANWKVVETSWNCPDVKSDGFYAVTFQGETTNGTQTVIAYRGSLSLTEDVLRIFTADGWSDWVANDVPFQAAHIYSAQLQEAQDYYTHCVNKLGLSKADISVTGHSLGGALASVTCMVFDVKAEIFNGAAAYETLYDKKPELAGKLFRGVDKWNIRAHIIDGDSWVGQWNDEYLHMPYHLYRQIGNGSTHSLYSFLNYDPGSDKASMGTPIRNSSIPRAANPGTPDLYLGTSDSDSVSINAWKEGLNQVAYGGDGNDIITITGMLSADKIIGGNSPTCDELDGGDGDDTYYYYKGNGIQFINDASGDDKIMMCGFSSTDKITYQAPTGRGGYGSICVNGEPKIRINVERSIFGSLKVYVDGKETLATEGFIWKSIRKFTVACPTDVDILDSNGNVVLTLKNGTEETTYTDYGKFYVFTDENGESVKYFDLVEGYDFRIRGVDNGTMTVAYGDESGSVYEVTDVPVTDGMIAVVSENPDGANSTPVLMIDKDSDGTTDSVVALEGSHEHAGTKVAATKPTVGKDGVKAHYECSCGEWFADAACTVPTDVTKCAIPMIKSVTLSKTAYTYTGKVCKPTVKVTDGEGNVIAATNYTVTYPSGMKNVGKYTVKVTFKGNYTGTKSVTYKIVPVKSAITKVIAAKKAFTVRWAKKTTQVGGYQIQYSLKKDFSSGNKTVTVSGNSNISKTIKSLLGGKVYYVRVRTYYKVNGVNYYSGWSPLKSVKTLK